MEGQRITRINVPSSAPVKKMNDIHHTLNSIMSYYGTWGLVVSCIGLIVGVFEMAFKRPQLWQLGVRCTIHMIMVPISTYLHNGLTAPSVKTSIMTQSVAMFAFCAVSVGFIGLTVGAFELLDYRETHTFLYQRMTLYVVALILGTLVQSVIK